MAHKQMQRSSFHFVTGDRQKNPVKRIIYRLCQQLEKPVYAHMPAHNHFQPYTHTCNHEKLLAAFGNDAVNSSPARVMSYCMLLEVTGQYFGPDKAVFDLGCGAGNYAGHIARNFGYRRYDGFDIAPRKEWEALADEKTHFHQAVLGEVDLDVTDVDIIFSQSALEHIKNDKAVLTRLTSKTPKTIRHIHSVPALASWQDFRYHGYRRYAPVNIDRLINLPHVRDVQIFLSGNPLTRAMRAQQKAASRGKLERYLSKHPEAKNLPFTYDASLSMAQNLAQLQELGTPTHALEATTFTITFLQDLK